MFGYRCSDRACALAVVVSFKPHRADPRDAIEAPLLKVAERVGGHWWPTPPLDGWIWTARIGWHPVEIKDPSREGFVFEYTPAQKRFFRWCSERNIKWFVWRTEADVIRDLGGVRSA